MPIEHKARDIDVSFHPYPIVPLFSVKPSVAVIYDVLCYAEPSERSWSNTIMLASLRLCAKRAKFIVTISEFSKSQIIKFLRVRPNKVIVAYPGCDHILSEMATFQETGPMEKRKRKYILSVLGSFAARKNGVSLIKAYEQLPSRLKEEYDLVIVATRSGKEWDSVKTLLQDPAIAKRVSITSAPTRRSLLSL